MKVLVVGGGGREHAIIRKLKESPRRPALYAAPGNGGIASDAVCVPIAATDVAGVVSFAVQEGIDYVVVAPDDPLAAGMVDALEAKGIPAFGPRKNAAVLEATSTDEWKTMVNNYCFQNPFVLNVEDTIANLTEQRNLFQSFVPFL